jgi:HSP20 family molecular chaperone IbpA
MADYQGSSLSRRPFADFFGFDPFRNLFSSLSTTQSIGGIELVRTDNGFNVEIPVAGFKPDEINVTLDQNVLTVSGKSDRRSFTRSLVLPDEIDPESVRANVDHGLLTLNLSYHPKSQPRQIKVEQGASLQSAQQGGASGQNVKTITGEATTQSVGQQTT